MTPDRFSHIASLAALAEETPSVDRLIKEWHPTKNRGRLTPETVEPFDTRTVWWRCKNGHSWQDRVRDRVTAILEGKPCSCIFCEKETVHRQENLYDYCTHPVPDGEIDVRYLLEEWDYEKNAPLTPQDVKTVSYTKVWWRCQNGHRWEALISNRVKMGVCCPYCGHRRVLPGFNDLATLYPALAAEWDPVKNTVDPTEVTAKSNRRAYWICPEGHSYEKIISNRTQYAQGCPVCRALKGEKGSMLISGVNDLATTHPEIAAEWNFRRNAPLTPSDVKAGSRTVVWWSCKEGHEWSTPVSRRTGKRHIGCPACVGSFFRKDKK